MTTFKNPLDPQNERLFTTLTQWLKERFGLSNDVTIEFNEHKCAEPSCIHHETIIKIIDPNRGDVPYFLKIAKPLIYIRRWDIDALQLKVNAPIGHKH
ncbi:MAG: hypothetical protein HC817_02290 [Saprospiraceae bacterium]|nr:hypothetical protein [Saprospiraceae bacterium]